MPWQTTQNSDFVNYQGRIKRLTDWVKKAVPKLIADQKAIDAKPLPEGVTGSVAGMMRIPEDGSALKAFDEPIECTLYLIGLYLLGLCVGNLSTGAGKASGDSSQSSTSQDAHGESVLK